MFRERARRAPTQNFRGTDLWPVIAVLNGPGKQRAAASPHAAEWLTLNSQVRAALGYWAGHQREVDVWRRRNVEQRRPPSSRGSEQDLLA